MSQAISVQGVSVQEVSDRVVCVLGGMTACVIHYYIITHIKITIQFLYCDPLPYCDHNTDSPFLFNYFFYNPPL